MYIEIVQKKPKIQNVNTLGARFIREAQVRLILCTYIHPSTDNSSYLVKAVYTPGQGVSS